MNYLERQEGYSWGLGCVFCLWMKKDESSASKGKKTKMKVKDGFHFVSGEKKTKRNEYFGSRTTMFKFIYCTHPWKHEEEDEEEEEEEVEMMNDILIYKKHQTNKRQLKRK